jgi:hypothetical protein
MLAAGASIGLSCWLRANSLLLALFIALAVLLLFERGRRRRYAAAIVLAAVVVIAPITIRNWIIYERFIPLSLGAGVTLIEGIGDYDKEGRFGLPSLDGDVQRWEAELYDRPDYADSLWFPDGVERDRDRLARGLSVIRSDPSWFMGVMARRSVFMLRYNDFLTKDSPINTTIAPTVLASSGYGHHLDTGGAQPVWSQSPVDLQSAGTAGEGADISLVYNGQGLLVSGDAAEPRDLFASPAIAIEKNTDYLLSMTVNFAQGELALRMATPDPKVILALANIHRVSGKKKKRLREKSDESATPEQQSVEFILPFASGDAGKVSAVIVGRPGAARPTVQIAGMQLLAAGPTPGLWTSLPRAAIRGLQKNVFKTERLLPLNLLGIALLVMARRRAALLSLLAVPLYYLLVQSAFHTEYRYILVIHYFLFLMSATALYSVIAGLRQALDRRRAANRRASTEAGKEN